MPCHFEKTFGLEEHNGSFLNALKPSSLPTEGLSFPNEQQPVSFILTRKQNQTYSPQNVLFVCFTI